MKYQFMKKVVLCLSFVALCNPVFAQTDFESSKVCAYLVNSEGEKIDLFTESNTELNSYVPVGELSLFSASPLEYSQEVEVVVPEELLTNVVKDTLDDYNTNEDGNVKVWVKVFFTRMYNDVLITRIQSNVRNNLPDRYRLSQYFVGSECNDGGKGYQIVTWRDLPLTFFDRYTGFNKFANIQDHSGFRVFARANVSVRDKRTGNISHVYMNFAPWGGVALDE